MPDLFVRVQVRLGWWVLPAVKLVGDIDVEINGKPYHVRHLFMEGYTAQVAPEKGWAQHVPTGVAFMLHGMSPAPTITDGEEARLRFAVNGVEREWSGRVTLRTDSRLDLWKPSEWLRTSSLRPCLKGTPEAQG